MDSVTNIDPIVIPTWRPQPEPKTRPVPNEDPADAKRIERLIRQRQVSIGQAMTAGHPTAIAEVALVGTTFALGDNYRRWVEHLDPHHPVRLVRFRAEWVDKHGAPQCDPNAVRVLADNVRQAEWPAKRVADDVVLGVLPAAVAQRYGPAIDAGYGYRASIAYVGQHLNNPQVAITIRFEGHNAA